MSARAVAMPTGGPIGGIEFRFEGTLKNEFALAFEREARRRKVSPAELATSILEVVARDKLFAAVLDE